MRIPRVKARRWYDLKAYGKTYKEGDSDFVENNLAACVWFLENRDKIKAALEGAKA